MMRRFAPAALAISMPVLAQSIVENSGRMAAMVYSGETTEVRTNLVLPTPGWQRTLSLPADNVTITREADSTAWRGSLDLDAERRLQFTQTVREAAGATVLTLDYSASADLAVEGLFLRLDLPWSDFASGMARHEDTGRSAALPATAPARPDLFSGTTAALAATSANSMLRWTARFDRPFLVNLQDKSGESPKAYTFWVYLQSGAIRAGTRGAIRVELTVAGVPDTSPARLTLDAGTARYRLHGFGGNYCFQVDSPVAAYTLDNLDVRWARVEMSLDEWEPVNENTSAFDIDWGRFEARDRPGSKTRQQFEMARKLQQRGIPYVISVWRLPEWMYADRGRRNPSDGQRKVDPALWDELRESIASYLLWARDRYGAEPDLFSFNEANIGVNVWLTPEEHRDAIRSIGAHLERMGLRTRMLLGDVHSPRGTEAFVAPAAADPEAMRYVGALSFHSWGGATPGQYAAWGDLAERLGLPLLVAELGTDAGGWHGRAYDSFWYGLGEARMYQELLLHARPQGTMYWEFTADYSLLGTNLAPTQRFWLTRHFTNLTPPMSEALAAASDQPKVLFTAFRSEGQYTFHLLNSGAERQVRIEGVPAGAGHFRGVRTGQAESFVEFTPEPASGGVLTLMLPERSLVTVHAPMTPEPR
jgi:hypothetical protein